MDTLRGWPADAVDDAVAPDGPRAAWDDQGLFQIVDLDLAGGGSGMAESGSGSTTPEPPMPAASQAWTSLPEAGEWHTTWSPGVRGPESVVPSRQPAGAIAAASDLVVFVVDGARHSEPAACRAYSRLRAAGRPLIAVVNVAGIAAGEPEHATAPDHPLAPVAWADVGNTEQLARCVVPLMVDACPAMAVALGREAVVARPVVVDRLVRRAALVALATGLEPIPLVDVPLQLAGQMKLLARLAAVHGRAGGDDGRGVMTSLGSGLVARYAFQQAVKLVPVAGWIASGLIGGLTTWMLGQVAAAHFAGRLALPRAGRLAPLRLGMPRRSGMRADASPARRPRVPRPWQRHGTSRGWIISRWRALRGRRGAGRRPRRPERSA